jgi:hypothetical protein
MRAALIPICRQHHHSLPESKTGLSHRRAANVLSNYLKRELLMRCTSHSERRYRLLFSCSLRTESMAYLPDRHPAAAYRGAFAPTPLPDQ